MSTYENLVKSYYEIFLNNFIKEYMVENATPGEIKQELHDYIDNNEKSIVKVLNKQSSSPTDENEIKSYVICQNKLCDSIYGTEKKQINTYQLCCLVDKYIKQSKFNIFNWDFHKHYNQQRDIKSKLIKEYSLIYPEDGFYGGYINHDHDSIDDILADRFLNDIKPPFDWDVVIQQWYYCEDEINGSTGHAISDSTLDDFALCYCMNNYESVWDDTRKISKRARKYAPIFIQKYNVPEKYLNDIIKLLEKSIEYGPG